MTVAKFIEQTGLQRNPLPSFETLRSAIKALNISEIMAADIYGYYLIDTT